VDADHDAAIRRLLARYCHCYDDGRAEDFAALFTEDARFEVFGRATVGRDAIREEIGTRKPGQAPGQHVTYNSVIEVGEGATNARAWTDFLYLRRDGDDYRINNAGRYHDRLVREADGWRFATRTIVFLGDPVPERA
jgi:uncharacterized protein (TIGR02246 family)